jgi:anti-sigma B factor antagonist
MSESPADHFVIKSVAGATIATFVGPKIVLEAREPLYELVEKDGQKRIVLNFRNVRFLSSAPIGVLINFKKKAEAAGGSVKFCCVDPDLAEIFRITSVLNLFDIRDTEEAALASF